MPIVQRFTKMEFPGLYKEFIDSGYLGSLDGMRHLDAYEEGRIQGRLNFESVVEAKERGEDVPGNVRLIGTMNTADRSIALVDHALRRRFAFLELYPDYDLLRKYHSDTGFPVDNLIGELMKLNLRIDDRHYEVGITFFLHEHLEEELEDIWRMEIEPYLEEYFFDRPSVVDEYRWERIGGTLNP